MFLRTVSPPPPCRRLALAVVLCLAAASAAGAQRPPDGLVVGAPATQTLRLTPGVNLVSLHVYPDDRSIASILGPQASKIVMARTAQGAVYAPAYGVSDLQDWPWDEAVLVYARQSFTLKVAGARIGPGSTIGLKSGWSWVPTFLDAPSAPQTAFASLGSSLSKVGDASGRAYPSAKNERALESVEPGTGYRVRLSSAAKLTYTPPAASPPPAAPPAPAPPAPEPPAPEPPAPEPPASARTVEAIGDAIALKGLAPGQKVVVRDPVRGGTFVVRDSGAPSDGGAVFVPTEFTKETTATGLDGSQTLFDGSGDHGVVFDSFRLFYGPGGSDYLDAVALHGHASGGKSSDGAGDPLLDPRTGRLTVPYALRKLAESLTGSDKLKATYRYATSARRLERVLEPILLEGRQTTDYVRPEWWGAVPYPQSWKPDTSAPSGPRATPRGIVLGDPVYDATDRLATAINAAEAGAARLGRQHYVVLKGMYGYARVIEMQDQAVLKGERDGVRDGQGLRVLKGAPWHFWAVKGDVDPSYYVERSPHDQLVANSDPLVVLRHGRQSQLNRVVDVELDGNLSENEYVFTDTYMTASGAAGNSIWKNRVEEMLQNTGHWNGFVASHQSADTEVGSNARLENVHLHDFGGNLMLGGEPIHFGGSRDIRLGNSRRNHFMYRVFTAQGTTIDRIEMYGYAWSGYVPFQQGHYRDVVFRDLVRNPQFGMGDRSPEELIDHRNNGIPADDLFDADVAPGYYFGDEATLENVRFELSADFRPRSGLVSYDTGPLSLLGVTLSVEGDYPVTLTEGGSTDRLDRARFRVEDVVVEKGQVRSLMPTAALSASARRIGAFTGGGGGQGVDLRPFRNGHVATLYDVGGGVAGPGARMPEAVKIWPRNENEDISLDVFVQRAHLIGVKAPVMMKRLDPTRPDVAARFRVFWRDVAFDDWQDENNDNGTTRNSGRLQHFERVTVGDRSSEASGSLSSVSLRSASDGTRYVDVDPKMFYAPQDPSFVTVTGRDAGRFLGWKNVGDKYAPVLRLSFSGTSRVTVNWKAAIRPIPSGVAFPE